MYFRLSPSGTNEGLVISSVKSWLSLFPEISITFGYIPYLASLETSKPFLSCYLRGIKSLLPPLPPLPNITQNIRLNTSLFSLHQYISIMSVFYYEPYYDFDRLLDDIFTPRTARHHFGGDQHAHRRALQSDATPEGAVRGLRPRFVK